MFFKKKKPKLDPKVRFQHKQFTSKLNSARTYKRQARVIPEGQVDKVLSTIGLGSRWSQILLGLFIAGVIYLIYVPNFLSVENIVIVGVSESQARDFEIAIRDEIASVPFYNPQRNLLFLQDEVINSALRRVPSIYLVSSIEKNISSQTITVISESKYEKFLVATPEKVYDVYNDGTLKKEAGLGRDQWEILDNPNMVKVLLYQEINGDQNTMFFHDNLFNRVNQLTELVKSVDGQLLAYITFKQPEVEPVAEEIKPVETQDQASDEVVETQVQEPAVPSEPQPLPRLDLPYNTSEIHAVFYKNNDRRRTYRVIFDATRDMYDSVNDLKLLLSQTNPDRYNQLLYIDLRLDTKAFLCLENSPCDK